MTQQHCPYCGASDLPIDTRVCPRCETEIGRDDEPRGTRLQSVAELRAEARATRTPTQEPVVAQESVSTRDATPFRPLHRPPTAILCLYHDGSATDGEEIVIRGAEFTIGRAEADLVIPHDEQISKLHVKIRRQLESGQYAWTVSDLGSTNGTFALVDEGVLRNGQELLLGSRRYRFSMAGPATVSPGGISRNQTSAWQSLAGAIPTAMARLVEVTPNGPGESFDLAGRQAVFGADTQRCDIVVDGDPFLGARHANFFQDRYNRWMVKPVEALNGVWLRTRSIRLERGGRFQIGDQRFSVRIP